MSDNVNIILIDDHSLVRDGIRALVEKNTRYKVIGEAGTAREGLELVKRLHPDIVILDIELPDKSGLHLLPVIKEASPETEVMMVSMYFQQNYINKALQEGAKAYVVKESGQEKLLKALAALESGDFYVDGNISEHKIPEMGKGGSDDLNIRDAAYESLTGREQEIMVMLAEGLSTKEIAGKIYISARTVENHRANLLKKLDIQNMVELVRYAARLGLIDLDTWL